MSNSRYPNKRGRPPTNQGFGRKEYCVYVDCVSYKVAGRNEFDQLAMIQIPKTMLRVFIWGKKPYSRKVYEMPKSKHVDTFVKKGNSYICLLHFEGGKGPTRVRSPCSHLMMPK